MKTTVACLSLVALLFVLPVLLAHHRAAAQTRAAVPALASLELTGPYVYQNLAIFAVHDRHAARHDEILTLREALAQKTVTIEEVGQVNQLVASNQGKHSVYLQAGDIVKGGQQDRVLQHDTVLPPNAKRVALSVFCVEAGRWHGRGHEPVRHFASSNATIMTKRQKMAVKVAGRQGDVWDSVAAAQADMGSKVGGSVRARESATSLQLSLEDRKVTGSVEEYVKNLEKSLPKDNDVVGYAVAVNGNVEALAAKTDRPSEPPKVDAVRALMADAESGAARTEKETLRTQVTRKETRRNVVFETSDPMVPAKAVHKSYLAK
jgi:hypothetical protein